MDSSPSGTADPAAPRRPWIVGVSGASGTPYAAAVIRALLAAGQPVDLVVSRAARLTLLDETGHPFRDAHWRDDLRRWLARGADGDPEAFGTALPPVASTAAGAPADSGLTTAGAPSPTGASADSGLTADGAPVDAPADGAPSPTGASAEGGPTADSASADSASVVDPAAGDLRYWAAGDLAAGPSSGSYPARGMIIVPASTASVAGVALGLSKDLLQRAASVTLKERRPLVVVVRETPLSGQVLRQLVALDAAGAVVLPASPAFYAGAVSAQELVDFVAGRALDAAGVPHRLYRRWQGTLGGGREGAR